MGQDQRIIDELRSFERLCLNLAEESMVPGEAGALLEMAENYGREAARLTVVKTVDRELSRRKRLEISARLIGRPCHQNISKTNDVACVCERCADFNVRWSGAASDLPNSILRQHVAD